MSTLTPAELVAAAFPYDGPHTPDRVAEAANTIDELTRYLANATQSRGALPRGADLAAVTGSLASALHRHRQVLDQLARAAERIAEDPTLYDDHDGDAPTTAAHAAAALREASMRVNAIGRMLDDAHTHASRLGHEA